MQHGASVIPKATSKDHVLGNLDVLDWELKPEDYEVIHMPFTTCAAFLSIIAIESAQKQALAMSINNALLVSIVS